MLGLVLNGLKRNGKQTTVVCSLKLWLFRAVVFTKTLQCSSWHSKAYCFALYADSN